jgi:orotidine-5'-phosphate decarboxylase
VSAFFGDRLQAAVDRAGNPCVVGIDPHLELLPPDFAVARNAGAPIAERAFALGDFACEVIDLANGRVPAVKLQSAFFEALGSEGVRAWERAIRCAREAGLLVIGDVKRGDIQSTAAAYAAAYLAAPPGTDPRERCDAITLNPLLGADSVEPFLEACRNRGAGIFVLVRTSNLGSEDFQLHGEPELSLRIAEAVARWGSDLVGESGLSSVGAVVGLRRGARGATLRQFRACMPSAPLLLPGFGAQGAGVDETLAAFLPSQPGRGPRGALIASSRAVTFAWREPRHSGRHWKDAASAALDEMLAALAPALRART